MSYTHIAARLGCGLVLLCSPTLLATMPCQILEQQTLQRAFEQLEAPPGGVWWVESERQEFRAIPEGQSADEPSHGVLLEVLRDSAQPIALRVPSDFPQGSSWWINAAPELRLQVTEEDPVMQAELAAELGAASQHSEMEEAGECRMVILPGAPEQLAFQHIDVEVPIDGELKDVMAQVCVLPANQADSAPDCGKLVNNLELDQEGNCDRAIGFCDGVLRFRVSAFNLHDPPGYQQVVGYRLWHRESGASSELQTLTLSFFEESGGCQSYPSGAAQRDLATTLLGTLLLLGLLLACSRRRNQRSLLPIKTRR